jgi:hypothetical protein
MTLRAMFHVDLAAGVGWGLCPNRLSKHGGADEKTDAQDMVHVKGYSWGAYF